MVDLLYGDLVDPFFPVAPEEDGESENHAAVRLTRGDIAMNTAIITPLSLPLSLSLSLSLSLCVCRCQSWVNRTLL